MTHLDLSNRASLLQFKGMRFELKVLRSYVETGSPLGPTR